MSHAKWWASLSQPQKPWDTSASHASCRYRGCEPDIKPAILAWCWIFDIIFILTSHIIVSLFVLQTFPSGSWDPWCWFEIRSYVTRRDKHIYPCIVAVSLNWFCLGIWCKHPGIYSRLPSPVTISDWDYEWSWQTLKDKKFFPWNLMVANPLNRMLHDWMLPETGCHGLLNAEVQTAKLRQAHVASRHLHRSIPDANRFDRFVTVRSKAALTKYIWICIFSFQTPEIYTTMFLAQPDDLCASFIKTRHVLPRTLLVFFHSWWNKKYDPS